MKTEIIFLAVMSIAGGPVSAEAYAVLAQADGQGSEVTQRTNDAQKPEEQKQYLYRWTDGKGVVHIADDLNKIPKQYRQNARKLESAPGESDAAGDAGTQVQTGPPGSGDAEERDADLKEEWQQRMRAAKRNLENAERRYRELEKKRDEAITSWGGPASGRLEGREEAAKIDDEMKQVRQEIDAARKEVEVTIPDEARRAGIPPGWLRE